MLEEEFNLSMHCYFLFSLFLLLISHCPLITLLLLHIFISHTLIYMLIATSSQESVPGEPLESSDQTVDFYLLHILISHILIVKLQSCSNTQIRIGSHNSHADR